MRPHTLDAFDLLRLRRLLVSRPLHRWAATLLVVAAVTSVRLVVGADEISHAPAVGILVVAVLGWLWGPVGGIGVGILLLPLGGLLVSWIDGDRVVPPAGVAASVLALGLVGLVVGTLRRVVGRLGDELEARRAAEERIRTIHDRLPIGVFRATADGVLVEANPAFARLVGVDRERLVGVRLSDLRLDGGGDGHGLRLDGDVVEGQVMALRGAGGSVVHGRFHCRLIRDERGEPALIEGAVREVTELLAREREAEEAQRLLRRAFDHAPIGMALAGLDGRLLRVNDAFAQLLGYTREELVGMTWVELTHPEDREEGLGHFAGASAGVEDAYEIEKRYLCRDGTPIWVLLRAGPVTDHEGRVQYVVAQVIDITARREAAEALEGLVKAKDEFVASVSHELRTPLTVVMGLAEELHQGIESFARTELAELVGLVAQQSREVASIVEDLLVAARADIGNVTVVPEAVEVAAQVAEVVASLPGTKGIAVEAVDAVVWADPVRLRQVVRNLLTNAVRYGGARVRVRGGRSGELVHLVVEDDGPGIRPELWDAIFEPYRRAHPVEGQTGSVGLGLTVARTLARLMGGDLGYRHEDGWSRFVLTLPGADRVDDERYHVLPAAGRA